MIQLPHPEGLRAIPNPIADRTSCLIERGRACVAGFDRLGHSFSADLTRQMVNALECGAPASLYDHWLAEQEARLRDKAGSLKALKP